MHGPTRIFWANLTPFSLQITSNGTNATVTVGAGQGLKVGDRFRVAGAAQPEFNGYWSVFTASGASFSYQMAEQPEPSSAVAEAGGAPQVTFAGFYFGAQKQSHNLPGDADSSPPRIFASHCSSFCLELSSDQMGCIIAPRPDPLTASEG